MPTPGIDLDFRPASYWDLDNPVAAILAGIKGQNRREMARDFVLGLAPAELGEIDASLLGHGLDQRTRTRLGALHPDWMGGEYLPDCLPGEVEIARIVLASVTRDVLSVRARRRRARYLYRMVDEYEEPGRPKWICRPASSKRPLTLGRLIGLIESATNPDFELQEGTLPDRFREEQYLDQPEMAADFVTVESEIYPGLAEYFERQAQGWLERRRRELEDEEEPDAT
ncbi:MAG TPA: hypothetical protein VJQ44_01785 [Gemmatimonadales bacterium]|nr:hypothetical protein [Gemmatimonadales bacterium]